MLVATWVGYPLVVWVLARARGPRPRSLEPANGPLSVTVVLASRETDEAIGERVADLLRAHYPPERLNVVVAIDASRPRALASGLAPSARVSIVDGDAPGGKAAALNAGVRNARGDVLVFADTAQRFAPGTVAALSDELAGHPALGAVSGALELGEPGELHTAAGLYWRFERWLRATEAQVHSPVGVTGAVYAMRRVDWEPLPPGLILDDLYVPMRLVLRGRRIGFRRDAVAVDTRRIDPQAEYRRKSRTLTGVFQLCHLVPSALSPSHNPIWVQFVFHKLLRLATPWLLAVLGIAAGWWVLASLPVQAALAAAGAVLVVVALVLALSPRVRRLAGEGLAMQAAVVQATRNALRGDWDVWRR